jgi:putative Mg2+ transporter-C (MgtC) family protein
MELEIIGQLILATIFGALIGFERELKKRGAGLKTFSLVSLGSCLFTIISLSFYDFALGKEGMSFDPSRIIQAIAVGVGFIGAGVIFRQPPEIIGLTTAAGLWVSSAIGIAVGAKLYCLAFFTTLIAIFILTVFSFFEKVLEKKSGL